MPSLLRLCACAGLFLSCCSTAANAASPCPDAGEPWLSLSTTTTALPPDTDRLTTLRVHASGCAEIHRPGYRRDAGDYRLDLDAAELAALRRQFGTETLAGLDSARLAQELAAGQRKRAAAESREENLSQPDADYSEIRWSAGGKRGGVAVSGLHGKAELYTDLAAHKALSQATLTLQALVERADAQRIAGGRR